MSAGSLKADDTIHIIKAVIVAANGLRIGEGRAFEKRQPNICTNAQ